MKLPEKASHTALMATRDQYLSVRKGNSDWVENDYSTVATSSVGFLRRTTIADREKARRNLVSRPRDGLCGDNG
jgi:hypothetical protein